MCGRAISIEVAYYIVPLETSRCESLVMMAHPCLCSTWDHYNTGSSYVHQWLSIQLVTHNHFSAAQKLCYNAALDIQLVHCSILLHTKVSICIQPSPI